LFLGLVFIAFALFFLLNNLGVVQVEHPWRFWPLMLMALGVARLLRPRGAQGKWGGFLLTALGAWLLLDNLGLWTLRLGTFFWPTVLLLLGTRLVWVGARPKTSSGTAGIGNTSSRISGFSILGGTNLRSTSEDFNGGDATAILGGCTIDLRQAAIKSGEAVIDVLGLWGGIEIFVPREWSVVGQSTQILAGYEDKTSPPAAGGPRLVVRGLAIMSGIEIKN
jgi:predicted membrane protein